MGDVRVYELQEQLGKVHHEFRVAMATVEEMRQWQRDSRDNILSVVEQVGQQHVLEWQKRAERAECVAVLADERAATACKEVERWLTLAPCLGEKQLVQLASSCDAPR